MLKNGAVLGSCENGEVVILEEISVSPNPTSGETVLRVNSAGNFNASLVIYNTGGVLISEEKIKLYKGTTDLPVMLGKTIPGIYILKVQGNNFESKPVKVIKY